MNEFQNYLRRFQLDELIFSFSNISKDMYNNDEFYRQIPAHVFYGSFLSPIGYVDIAVYNFHKIIYNAIISSNDYRGKIPDGNDIAHICDEYNKYSNEVAKEKVEDFKSVEILFGLSQEQFWYQRKYDIFEQINRNFELLCVIPNEIKSNIPIEDIVIEKVGLSIIDFYKIMFLIFGKCSEVTDFSKVVVEDKLLELDKCFNEENVRKVINHYCIDYKGIREEVLLKEKVLYTKPFIKTQKGNIVAVNQFIINKKCADGVYWIIRDYYRDRGSQDFINEFGRYFEKYFSDLLEYYLRNDDYKEIKEDNKNKLADWIIYSTNYILLIEQKSCLARMETKNEYPDTKILDKFFDKFKEAFIQLDSTEKIISVGSDKKVIIKVALHYEELYVQSIIRDRVIEKCKGEISNCDNYFIIGISEMEKLINTLSQNETKYENIIEDLINIQKATNGEGKELIFILNKHEVYKNDYLFNVKNHTKSIFKNIHELEQKNKMICN